MNPLFSRLFLFKSHETHIATIVKFWYVRIRIRGSVQVTLTNGSGSGSESGYGSCSLSSVTFKTQKKISMFVFPCYFLKVHLNHSSKIKCHKEVTIQYKSRFSLLVLLDDGRIRIRTSVTNGSRYCNPPPPQDRAWDRAKTFKTSSKKCIVLGFN